MNPLGTKVRYGDGADALQDLEWTDLHSRIFHRPASIKLIVDTRLRMTISWVMREQLASPIVAVIRERLGESE